MKLTHIPASSKWPFDSLNSNRSLQPWFQVTFFGSQMEVTAWRTWFHGTTFSHQMLYYLFFWSYCWWFRNPANQLRLVVYPIICKAFIHPRWSTVSGISGPGWPPLSPKSLAENCAGSRDRCQWKVVGHGTTYQSLSAMSWTDQWWPLDLKTVDPSIDGSRVVELQICLFMFTPEKWGVWSNLTCAYF